MIKAISFLPSGPKRGMYGESRRNCTRKIPKLQKQQQMAWKAGRTEDKLQSRDSWKNTKKNQCY